MPSAKRSVRRNGEEREDELISKKEASTKGIKPEILKPHIQRVARGDDLALPDAEESFRAIIDGADELQAGAFLMLIRSKGITHEEIAGFSRASNCHAQVGSGEVLDILSADGGNNEIFDIATAASVLAAACGCRVARVMPSMETVSSAKMDATKKILKKLEIPTELSPDETEWTLNKCRIAFVKDPRSLPSKKLMKSVEEKLGVATCLDLIGPLKCVHGAQYAVINVARESYAEIVAGVLQYHEHIEHALVIYCADDTDFSPLGKSKVFEVANVAKKGRKKKYKIRRFIFDPLELKMPRCQKQELLGTGGTEELCAVLSGGNYTNAKRDAVVLNAAAACYVYGICTSIYDGVAIARKALEEAEAFDLLKKLTKPHNWARPAQPAPEAKYRSSNVNRFNRPRKANLAI